MLRSCSLCGRLHRYDDICPKRIEYDRKRRGQYEQKERNSKADIFRSSSQWQKKRSEIRSRDLNICRCCFLLYHRITTTELSVHHIIPLEKRFDLRLRNTNLITLCRDCHEKAELGMISVEELRVLLKKPLILSF